MRHPKKHQSYTWFGNVTRVVGRKHQTCRILREALPHSFIFNGLGYKFPSEKYKIHKEEETNNLNRLIRRSSKAELNENFFQHWSKI